MGRAAEARYTHEEQRARPLTDAELDRIPVAARDVLGGLSRSAKDNYRHRRRLAKGGTDSYAGRGTLADAMGVSLDTVDRTTAELVEKGYAQATQRYRGRARVFILARGDGEVYRLPRRTQDKPHSAVREPQPAAHIEEPRSEEDALQAFLLHSQDAAASPEPAVADSAAAEEEAEVIELELTPEIRAHNTDQARKLYERLVFGADGPRHERAEPGLCMDECGRDGPRLQYGSVAVCTPCSLRRHAAAMKVAASVAGGR